MAKWFGKIGYAETVDTGHGIWEPQYSERYYYGDMIPVIRRLESSGSVNDNIDISNKISVVSDPYAIQHFHAMKYAEISGVNWKVTSVEVQYPRLILTLGGLYNGQTG